MRDIMKLFRREIFELLSRVRGVIFVFALPSLFLLLSGQLRVQDPQFRVLLAGVTRMSELEMIQSKRMTDGQEFYCLLSQYSNLDVDVSPGSVDNPKAVMLEGNYDLLINVEGSEGQWDSYTVQTHYRRLLAVESLQRDLLMTEFTIRERSDSICKNLTMMGSFYLAQSLMPDAVLVEYYEGAEKLSLGLLPDVVSFIICLIPFALAVAIFYQDQEAKMIEILLSLFRPSDIFIGKCLMVLSVSFIELILMVILMQSVFRIYMKPGFSLMVFLMVPAFIACTMLGVSVSLAVRSQTQTAFLIAVYFLCLLLFSGLAYPLDQTSVFIQVISRLVPLTIVKNLVNTWLLGVSPGLLVSGEVIWLVAQCFVYTLLAVFLYRKLLRRL